MPECQYQKQALQVVYIRAYVEITRLLAQYEVIINERKTVTAMDVVYALKRQGRTLYGFGG
jgi:histone H3/H4